MNNFQLFFDVPLVLTLLVLISGIVALSDILFFAKRRGAGKDMPVVFEYARSFFPIFLLVLLIRSFLIQPYRVPTGSLEPTVLPGDFIIVNQYAYGLRLPVLNYKILDIGEPKRGDITLFRYPNDPSVIFVKRVIGLPGDHIVYVNKTLVINGKVMRQTSFGTELEIGDGFYEPVQVRLEHLDGADHKIFIKPGRRESEFIDLIVPKNSYFMMGDNRDNSNDSREWGVVPEENLVGKAFGVWMSWDSINKRVRFSRIGSKIS